MTHSRELRERAVEEVKHLRENFKGIASRVGCTPGILREWVRQAERAKLMDGDLALCLSGGGLRATFFHLGVIKLLADIGRLDKVRHVFSVSGGSILAAHMATRWSSYVKGGGDFQIAADELREFAQRDIRNRVLRKLYRLKNRTLLLAGEFEHLFREYALQDLSRQPHEPQFWFLATGLTTGNLYALHRDGLSYVVSKSIGSREGELESVKGPERAPLSLAVAMSSAFPMAFEPVSIAELGAPSNIKNEYLFDGGVFDNLGTSRIHLFLGSEKEKLSGFIASDASAWFDVDVKRPCSLKQVGSRALDILMRQVVALEIENWQVDEEATHPLLPCQTVENEEVVPFRPLPMDLQKETMRVKTDFDSFSLGTLKALVLHGYGVAARSVAQLADSDRTPLSWDPWPEVTCLKSDIQSDQKIRWLPWRRLRA